MDDRIRTIDQVSGGSTFAQIRLDEHRREPIRLREPIRPHHFASLVEQQPNDTSSESACRSGYKNHDSLQYM